jgi:signal transduction histidine kinase/ActR/RegA family two-component response regulator
LLIGLPLSKVAEDVAELRPVLVRLEQNDSLSHAEPLTHFVERILERPETPWNLGAKKTDAEGAIAHFRATSHRGPVTLDAVFRMLECLAEGDDAGAYAIACAEEALLFQPTGQLQTEFAIAIFTIVVARGAPAGDVAADATIAGAAARFAKLARFEATTFGGYHALVEAARLERAAAFDEAAQACDRAIDVFERDRTLHLLAFANELAARVHARAGRERIARFYRESARRAYERWGAPRALRRLDAELGLAARDATTAAPGEPLPVDFLSLLKAARAITSETELDRLTTALLRIVAENAGANRAHLFLERDGTLALEARCDADLTVVRVLPDDRVDVAEAPYAVATLVARTHQVLVRDDASVVPQSAVDPYLVNRGRVALLAAPIERQGKIAGVVVLENDLVPGAFAQHHVDVVAALNAQIAVALENAGLYDELRARAASLEAANERLRNEMAERERAQLALAESESRLRQAQKMEAIGLLAGGVAHDFNNILTIIGSCSILALGSMPPDDPSREFLVEIQRAGESAASLTRRLLAFSRRQVVVPRDISLGAVVRDLAPMLARLLPERGALDVSVGEGNDTVHADPGQVEQVVLNLVVNARDAMPDGGQIRVAVVASPGAAEPVRLRVRDEGIGMDEATRARIFEPFFTTKGARGTGLGLSTVYGIVTDAGGTIDVHTAPGDGTMFEIGFPVVAKTGEAQAPAEITSHGAGERVLVVDDDAGIRSLVEGILTTHGYDVTTAGGLTEACATAERLERGPHPLDLVLADFLMPGGNGRELVERLQRMRPSLPALYMSAYTDEVNVRHLARHGVISVLAKPFTPTALLEAVRAGLDRE